MRFLLRFRLLTLMIAIAAVAVVAALNNWQHAKR